MIPSRAEFPEGFVFGAATAAYQIEGAAYGGAGSCHWDTFAATPGNVVRAETGARACAHYHLWPEDLDLVRDADLDAYRFSTSWARVQPDGRGPANPEGLDFYDRLVDGMLARGLAPYLTLYHWDLPSPLADLGGWTNRDTCARFADYAMLVMGRIGDRVARTATINEPWCVAWLSHFLGHHAPGLRDIRAAARAMHHILLAHGQALAAMRAAGFEGLGIVLNFEAALPASDAPADIAARDRQHAIYNRWFIEALCHGTYPSEALDGLARHLPSGWQDDMTVIAAPIDWLGVNYYTRSLIAADPDAAWPSLKPVPGPLKKTQMGWEIYPQGLADTLTWLARDHVGDLPMVVTENGMASDDAPESEGGGDHVADPQREGYIAAHLRAVLEARAAGANMQGFFYWSLLDNYEWAFGYEKRFGLVHVDFDSLQRVPKASYQALRRALARN